MVVSVINPLGAPLVPTIAKHLHASLASTQWSLTATLLVGAVAAVAGSLAVLILGRAAQGLGLALMPLTMASAREHLAPNRAGGVLAMLSVIGAVGVDLGDPTMAAVTALQRLGADRRLVPTVRRPVD